MQLPFVDRPTTPLVTLPLRIDELQNGWDQNGLHFRDRLFQMDRPYRIKVYIGNPETEEKDI